MTQLSLNIKPCLAYAADNFYLHQGVKNTYESCLSLLNSNVFRICFVQGVRRCGKTHFSIKLADNLMALGMSPRLIDGSQFSAWLEEYVDKTFRQEDVLVVDDADHYLSSIVSGQSGEFVSFVEKLRNQRSAMVLLSSMALKDFSFDDHIRSRLLPGEGFSIGAPSADDMFELVELMARQRGLAFSERKVDYLEKRIGRDIPAIEEYLDRLEGLAKVLGKPIKFSMLGDAV